MSDSATKKGDNDISVRVESALEIIRPYLIKDKGNVRLLEITEDNDVLLEFMGNCHDCPLSEMTFRAGVEQTIRNAVPEIKTIKIV